MLTCGPSVFIRQKIDFKPYRLGLLYNRMRNLTGLSEMSITGRSRVAYDKNHNEKKYRKKVGPAGKFKMTNYE